jgi:hypothetical protein
MAPVPPHTAKRLKYHYQGPFGQHTMLFHGVTGVTDGDLVTAARQVAEAMAALQWNGTTWQGAELSQPGSGLYFPVDAGDDIVGSSGFSPGGNSAPSYMLSFTGRSQSTGVRARLFMFEGAASYTPNMRYTPGESAQVDGIIQALIDTSSVIGAIDGSQVIWHFYANAGQNDYITRRARNS